MEFRKLVGWAKGHRNVMVVAALVFLLAGADLLLNRPKNPSEQWFSIPLLAAGFTALALILWPTAKPGPRPREDTLARRFLWFATWHGRLVPLFPMIGVALIVADLVFNRFVSSTPALLNHDVTILLFASALIGYRFVPERYATERDFIVLLLLTMLLILVVPLAILRIVVADPTASVDAYSAFALAPQTSTLLGWTGVPNALVYDSTNGTPGLSFVTAARLPVLVYITSACSGIYSFAIFSSAFTAYVMTEQRRWTPRVVLFFLAGIVLAYVANILRMVVIVLIGYHYDSPETGIQALLVAHSNAGWIIFLAWISLFWAVLFRFLPRATPSASVAPEAPPPRRGTFCGICAIVLTPAIPATRCTCGRFYHVECLRGEGQCPNCSAPSPSPYSAVDHPAV